MKKIIIFGGYGNTGKYLIDYLYDNIDTNTYKLIAVGRKKIDRPINNKADYISMDIVNRESFDVFDGNDIYAVINLAGAMPAQTKENDPYIYINTNVIGTLNILDFCVKNNVDRVIYPQTEADLSGYWNKEKLIKPDFPRKYELTENYGVYVTSKCTAVDLIKYYNMVFGLKAFIFRCPTIYLYKSNPYYYVNGEKRMLGYRKLIQDAIEGKDIELWGDPKREKDIVYVKDYCQLIYKALFVNKNFGIYNVGTGVGVSLQEQIEGIIEVFCQEDKKSKIIYCPLKDNAREFIMDISNAKDELGYEPKYDYFCYIKDFKKNMLKDVNNK